jgi:hypothetical protein
VSENGNGSAPPAKRGRSGLYVKTLEGLKLRDKKAERLVRKMFQLMPWLEPSDRSMARGFAELEIMCGQAYAVLRAMGIINAKGDGRRLLDDYRKLRQTQAVYARELGMSPASRMALKASGTRAALDLAGAMAKHVNGSGEAEEAETDG